jgi:hypothetical protein
MNIFQHGQNSVTAVPCHHQVLHGVLTVVSLITVQRKGEPGTDFTPDARAASSAGRQEAPLNVILVATAS